MLNQWIKPYSGSESFGMSTICDGALFLTVPQALLVFVLYVRATAINPADPGIMFKFGGEIMNVRNSKLELPTKSGNFDELGTATHSSPSSASRSSLSRVNSSRKGSIVEERRTEMQFETPRKTTFCDCIGGICCGVFVHEDCRKEDGLADQQGTGEEALYCTLCEAEVLFFEKKNYSELIH